MFGSPPPLLHRLVTENRKNANSIEKPETFDRSSESSGDSSSVQSIHQLDQTIKKLVLGSPVNTRRSTKTLEVQFIFASILNQP